MKIGLIISIVLVIVIGLLTIGWYGWWYPKTYGYALQLADDASLPEVKVRYLKEYVELTKQIKGQPAYVFMRKDLELETQREILNGLIKRFEDVAKIEPSNMAYQQGMEQLTGQEINHQLDRISYIFRSASLRENIGLFFTITLLQICSWLVFVIFGFIKLTSFI